MKKKSGMRKMYRTPGVIWARYIHCSMCNSEKPGYGAKYYSGDCCICADCITKGRTFKPPFDPGEYKGIIGVDIEQYEGQRTAPVNWMKERGT